MARLYRSSNFNQLSQAQLAKACITWLLHTGPMHKSSVATSLTKAVLRSITVTSSYVRTTNEEDYVTKS